MSTNSFLQIVNELRGSVVREVTPLEAYKAQQEGNSILLDVREDREWVQGRIDGAVHIGKGVIEAHIESAIPDRNQSLILYCGGGYRSVLAAESLMRMGYTDVASMSGGFSEWSNSALPTTDPADEKV